jgi:nucleoside-diphosphate-sugar epimerase
MVNGLGTLKVLKFAKEARVQRIVYASSSSLVGSSVGPMPVDEESISLSLRTPYQITKLLGELYCNLFKNLYGCETVRVRFFNSYGPGEMPGRYRNVIPNFVWTALQGLPLRITGTGDETRDWTYVEDIVDGLLRAGTVEEAAGEVFNIASGRETRVIDLARRINELTGNDAGVTYTERREWDAHGRRWASIDKAKRILGYEPQIDLHTGLERTVAWFREKWPRIHSRVEV